MTFNGIQFSETIQQITTGSYHSFALTSYGKVYAWGLNGNGELGDGTRSNRLTPTQITFNALSVGEKIENISAGNRHTHSITSFGRVLAWGLNSNGQLGDGTTSNTLIPITIENILVNLFILLENYISTTYNQTISLANPTLEGYTFIGWYMDQTLIVPLNLTIMPAYDLILYAKFIPT
jgi:uncharacterized repeat protein (TIGR02543 family)